MKNFSKFYKNSFLLFLYKFSNKNFNLQTHTRLLSNYSSSASNTFCKKEKQIEFESGVKINDHNKSLTDDDKTQFKKFIHPYKNIYPWKSKDEFASFLFDNICYFEDGLVIINKPFGVGVYSQEGKEGYKIEALYHIRGIGQCEYTFEDVIPNLREKLFKSDLKIIKSIQKYSSGVSIFGYTDAAISRAKFSMELSKNIHVISNIFYAITTNINLLETNGESTMTDFKEERCGVTIHSNFSNVKKPVIVKEFSRQEMKKFLVKPSNVYWKIISSNSETNTALIEIHTSQTSWDFVKVYLSSLLMPVLGDQIYSSRVQKVFGGYTKINPFSTQSPATYFQKLEPSVMKALQIKLPEESLIIPPHIHLKSYTLPRFINKEDVTFNVPLPSHFNWTCEKLGLKYPQIYI